MRCEETSGSKQCRWRSPQDQSSLNLHSLNPERLEDLEAALNSAREASGPAVVCIRSDRDANLAIPGELGVRFGEVYQGPIG